MLMIIAIRIAFITGILTNILLILLYVAFNDGYAFGGSGPVAYQIIGNMFYWFIIVLNLLMIGLVIRFRADVIKLQIISYSYAVLMFLFSFFGHGLGRVDSLTEGTNTSLKLMWFRFTHAPGWINNYYIELMVIIILLGLLNYYTYNKYAKD